MACSRHGAWWVGPWTGRHIIVMKKVSTHTIYVNLMWSPLSIDSKDATKLAMTAKAMAASHSSTPLTASSSMRSITTTTNLPLLWTSSRRWPSTTQTYPCYRSTAPLRKTPSCLRTSLHWTTRRRTSDAVRGPCRYLWRGGWIARWPTPTSMQRVALDGFFTSRAWVQSWCTRGHRHERQMLPSAWTLSTRESRERPPGQVCLACDVTMHAEMNTSS